MAYKTKLIDWPHVPDSLRNRRYDIIANAGEMPRALPEGRFNLKFHRETKYNSRAQADSLPGSGMSANAGNGAMWSFRHLRVVRCRTKPG